MYTFIPLPLPSPRLPSLPLHMSLSPPSSPSRRVFLSASASASAALLPLLLRAAPSRAALDTPQLRGLDEPLPDGLPPFRRVRPGLLVQDVYDGRADAQAAGAGALVGVKYVLRRSNGYLIYQTPFGGFDDDFSFRLGAGEVVQGFEEAVSGLKPGARRRFIVAPELGYATSGTKPGTSPGPLPPDWGARRSIAAHAKEPLLFEVLVERVKPAR